MRRLLKQNNFEYCLTCNVAAKKVITQIFEILSYDVITFLDSWFWPFTAINYGRFLRLMTNAKFNYCSRS